MLPGIMIGVLIGVVTGAVALILLRAATREGSGSARSAIALTTELLAIPAFWFGGPWLTGEVLQSVDLTELVTAYVGTLAVTFTGIVIYPMLRWISQLARELGGEVS